MSAISGLGAADFLSGMQGLLPPGDGALSRDPQAMLTTLLAGLVGRMVDVHANVALLSEQEADPRQAVYLLPDWEKSFGLPDPCLSAPASTVARRAQLLARIAGRGGQSPAYIIGYAENLGYTITITEFKPFTFGSKFGGLLMPPAARDVWQVNAPSITVQHLKFGRSNFGDYFASVGNNVLQCEIETISPAHTMLLFAFS